MLTRQYTAPAKGSGSRRVAKAPLSISRLALLLDGSDAEFRRLIYRMIVTQSRLVEIRKRIAQQVGVTGAQYQMLMAILRLEGADGVSISQIAEYLEVSGPHVTGEVKKLVAAGYVKKDANPRDMRSVQIRLSGVGRKRLLKTFGYIRHVNDTLFEGVSMDEFRALVRFNRRFMVNTSLALELTRKSGVRNRGSDLANVGDF